MKQRALVPSHSFSSMTAQYVRSAIIIWFSTAADVYALQPRAGKGGWTWYTGSAGWMYRAGLEYILGFQKNGNSVIMNPFIPKKWLEYSIVYQFINTRYSIKVKNPEKVNKGVKSISVDGNIFNENMIPLVNDGKNHNVEVIMGYDLIS